MACVHLHHYWQTWQVLNRCRKVAHHVCWHCSVKTKVLSHLLLFGNSSIKALESTYPILLIYSWLDCACLSSRREAPWTYRIGLHVCCMPQKELVRCWSSTTLAPLFECPQMHVTFKSTCMTIGLPGSAHNEAFVQSAQSMPREKEGSLRSRVKRRGFLNLH